jgi:hypothetical protein
MARRILPNTYLESRHAIAVKIQNILGGCVSSTPDERTTYFIHGFLLGLLLGHVIGVRDGDSLDELLPGVSREIREGIPFGHPDVSSPEVDAIEDDDVPLYDAGFDLWAGISNDRYYYEKHGRDFPMQSTCIWLGYLSGILNSNRITTSEYEKARALLPSINDDPTSALMPILQVDELLVKRAQRALA